MTTHLEADMAEAEAVAVPGRNPRESRVALVSFATAVVATALATLFLTVQAGRANGDIDARREALASAKQRVPLLLSYDSSTLDDDLATARSQTTGNFASDYAKILDEVVKPQAKARSISTQAKVSAAGVVRGDSREVVVLLFLTQTTISDADGSTVAGSRIEVTLVPVGGGWKIAGLKPV